MVTLGPPTKAESSLTTSPLLMALKPHCEGMPTWFTVLLSMRNGRMCGVTRAFAVMAARGVMIRTVSRPEASVTRGDLGPYPLF